MPGYTGFVPSATAEHIFGHTQASVGHTAMMQQSMRHRQRSAPSLEVIPDPAAMRPESRGSGSSRRSREPDVIPGEHPLGKSRAEMVRNHWVPTIPGYSGYIPGKHAENICGGGIINTCKMAGRTIAERSSTSGLQRSVGPQEVLQPGAGMDHTACKASQDAAAADERLCLATGIRAHCSGQLPGYTGHIPRINGESIHGATARAASLIAADYCEDRIFNPEEHARRCGETQGPGPRQLRL